jgi:hypothetical protein
MKRLLLIALVIAAAWYGWKHQDELRSRGTHEIVALNHSGKAIERLRFSVAGTRLAMEVIEDGASEVLPLRCEQDGAFELHWNVRGRDGEPSWRGGSFNHGPVLMRHRFEFTPGDGVIWSSERIPTKGQPAP